MATLSELLAQKAELERQIAETQRSERAAAVAQVREIMAQHGLTLADIGARATTAASPMRSKVAVKYRDPDTGQTWTGRGLQPNWLKAALAQGRPLSDFSV